MIAGNLKFGAAESFNKGTAPTFLEATEAKKGGNFSNAWDRVTFIVAAPGCSFGAPNDIKVANNGVQVQLGYEEKLVTICDDGVESTFLMLVKRV